MRLPEFKLERYFAQWEFTTPHLLCASDVETLKCAELLSMADEETRALWDGLSLGYTESAGHRLLREAIAGLYETVAPEEVLVFAGAEEAIFVLSNVLLGPGDHAVAVWPAYESLIEVGRATGAEVTLVRLEESGGWQLDLSAVQAAVRTNTRLIVVNFPNNPTGAMIDRAMLDGLVRLAAEAGAILFSDEVYRLLEYDAADRLPAAADLSRSAISLGVMSKAFGLAGLRIGWIATHDADLLHRMAAFKDYTTICSSAPSEILAIIALRASETILRRNRDIVLTNLALLDVFFRRHSDRLSWVRPAAGAIGFAKLLGSVAVDEFARDLVEKQGVLILPGTVYGDQRNHFRVGFGRRNFPESLQHFETYLARRG